MNKSIIDKFAARKSTDEEAKAIIFANQWAIDMQSCDYVADRYLQVCLAMANIPKFDIAASDLAEISESGTPTGMEKILDTEDSLWLTLTNHRASMALAILDAVDE